MNPAFMDNMSWEMAEVYGAVTDQILINLAKYFRYYKPGEAVPKSSFEYQARMLAQMGQVNAETVRIIRNGLDGADEALKKTLEQAIIDAVSKAEPELLDAVKRGIFSPAGVPIVAPQQMRAFQLYYQQAADKLNLVNTVMLESTRSAYQQTITDVMADIDLSERMAATYTALDVAAGETITGVSSWNEALRHATQRMTDRGIVGFVDHAGRRWSAEAYAAMDIRTTVFGTGRAAVWETNQNFGNDLYQVSYHNGARPLCYPWQNKVISSLDAARSVQDLDGNSIEVIAQSATSYGKPAGLFGINCRHYPTPFIPGVSIIRGKPQNQADNDLVYEQSQQQRGLERKIREQRRDLLMMRAQGAPDDMIRAQKAKIRQTDDEIDEFCKETGRARRQNREGVFTKREFPDADRYDVGLFEREQQERLKQYYQAGGAQQGYSFWQMTPKAPIVPPAPPAPPTAPPAAAVAKNVVSQTTTAPASVVQSTAGVMQTKDFGEFKKYMDAKYGIDVTVGLKKLDFQLVKEAVSGFEDVAADFPEVAKNIKQLRLSKSGVMSCNGDQITFNSDYFTDPKDMIDGIDKCIRRKWWQDGTTVSSIGAHETAHGVEWVLIEKSGKYMTPRSKVNAWNNCYEAREIVKDACDELLQLPVNKGKTGFTLIREQISGYGAKGGNSETMAEAFADVNARGANATPLARKIYELTLAKYRKYMGVSP